MHKLNMIGHILYTNIFKLIITTAEMGSQWGCSKDIIPNALITFDYSAFKLI